MRTIKPTPALITQGKAAFAVCGACHGTTGEGKTGMGPRLNSKSFLAAASDAFLIDTITKGRAGTTMIAWGAQLGPDKVGAVVGVSAIASADRAC